MGQAANRQVHLIYNLELSLSLFYTQLFMPNSISWIRISIIGQKNLCAGLNKREKEENLSPYFSSCMSIPYFYVDGLLVSGFVYLSLIYIYIYIYTGYLNIYIYIYVYIYKYLYIYTTIYLNIYLYNYIFKYLNI